MRQLVVLLCVLGCFAAGVQADSITSRVETWSLEDPSAPGGYSEQAVTLTDYLFSFENFSDGLIYGPGQSATVTLGDSSAGQIEMTLTISRPGSFFQFSDLTQAPSFSEASWGTRSIDPFVDVFNPAPLVFDVSFNAPGMSVVQFGIDVGDFGPSDHDVIEIPNLPDRELDNQAVPGFTSLSLLSLSILRTEAGQTSFAVFGGSPELPSSVFWDNVQFSIVGIEDMPIFGSGGGGEKAGDSTGGAGYFLKTGALPPQPVPEPGTLVLLGFGLAAGALWLRRRR